MKLLKDKIAFVTGGSRGIGAAIVKIFAEHGAHVGFSYLENAASADKVLEDLRVFGNKYKAYPCDATDSVQVHAVLGAFLEEFGGIDILVNNVGIIKDSLILSMPYEDWKNVVDTNLDSAFLHTQIALKTMVSARKGLVINVSSVVGIDGNAGQTNYSASKSGLIGFTKSVAKEVGGRNIRCNAIAPGIIATDMTESIGESAKESIKKNIALRRIGTPEEVADVALFLASDLSRYMTGQVLRVCGGMSG